MRFKYTTFIWTLVLTFFGTSCNKFLDVVPSNIAVIEEAFESRDNAIRFLATLYGYLPQYVSDINPALTAGDEIAVNINIGRNWPGHIIGRGGQNKVNPLLGSWNGGGNMFIALRDCNIFLENLDKPFDLTDSERNRWTAEAKILKAYFHFYLLRMYGPIPIIEKNIPASEGEEGVRVPRASVDEVVSYTVKLLDEALASNELPAVINDIGTELGRLTKVSAATLKAQVLLTAASPFFNGNAEYSNFKNKDGKQLFNQSYSEEKWKMAVSACDSAIQLATQNGHRLYEFIKTDLPGASDSTYRKLTVRGAVSEPWNDEILWGDATSSYTSNFQSWCQPKVNPLITAESRESTQSFWSPTLEIAELFYSDKGVPIEEDKSYDYSNRYKTKEGTDEYKYYIQTGQVTAILNFNREPRFYGYMGFDKGVWEGHGQKDNASHVVLAKKGERAGLLDASRWSQSGYFVKKLIHWEAFQSAPTSGYTAERAPYAVFRLADLYLMYAEALNETGSSADAILWVDRVRKRAGLNGVVASWGQHSRVPNKPASKDGLREIIHQERLIELAFEGSRFWDLRRWKKAEKYMNAPIRGWNVQGETTETYYNVVSYGRYQFSKRDYLWPIAEFEILTNPNLVQNPGW